MEFVETCIRWDAEKTLHNRIKVRYRVILMRNALNDDVDEVAEDIFVTQT